MSIYLVVIITFLTAVIFTSLLFMTLRNEPANMKPDEQVAKQINTLSARISALEQKKVSKVDTAEFTDAIKQVMKDHQEIKMCLSDFALNFNTTVTRLIATFKPKEKTQRLDV